MKASDSSKNYAQKLKDWKLYEESLVSKFKAGGMSHTEACLKARIVMEEQERLRDNADQRKKEKAKKWGR